MPADSLAKPEPASMWRPLRHEVFRALWIAGVVSNVGTWMQSVGGAWFMTLLTTSPVPVALMQTATSLPVFLVGLPAGAVADIVDRRRLLLFTQAWMLLVAAILSATTFLDLMTPWLLLGLTFALGLGSAMNTPAWQAITPEIVPREDLAAAVTLSGVSFNIARAIGPALGGLFVASAGPAWVFLLNALSFVGVILVIYRWQRDTRPQPLPPERLMSAMRVGWRYVRYSPALVVVIVRAGVVHQLRVGALGAPASRGPSRFGSHAGRVRHTARMRRHRSLGGRNDTARPPRSPCNQHAPRCCDVGVRRSDSESGDCYVR